MKVVGHVRQDSCQGANPKRCVSRDRYVMLLAHRAGEPDVAVGLASHPVSQGPQGLRQIYF